LTSRSSQINRVSICSVNLICDVQEFYAINRMHGKKQSGTDIACSRAP
jgi:hypothetical protein